MTQFTEQLLNQAMQLSQNEREELADQLYLSLHASSPSQEDVESAWSAEIAQRLEVADEACLSTSQEVHEEIRALLRGE